MCGTCGVGHWHWNKCKYTKKETDLKIAIVDGSSSLKLKLKWIFKEKFFFFWKSFITYLERSLNFNCSHWFSMKFMSDDIIRDHLIKHRWSLSHINSISSNRTEVLEVKEIANAHVFCSESLENAIICSTAVATRCGEWHTANNTWTIYCANILCGWYKF